MSLRNYAVLACGNCEIFHKVADNVRDLALYACALLTIAGTVLGNDFAPFKH